MRSLAECLKKALRTGVITQRQAKALEDRIAAGASETIAVDSLIKSAMEQRRTTALHTLAMKNRMADVDAYRGGDWDGVMALLRRDPKGWAEFSNADFRARAVFADTMSHMAEAAEALKAKKLGLSPQVDESRKLVRALFNEPVEDAAIQRYARQVADAQETIRMRHNAAGGNIAKRKDYGLTLHWDPRRIAKVPMEQWRDFILPKLKRGGIYSEDGSRVLNSTEVREFVEALHGEFVADAAVKVKDIPRGMKRISQHRRLTFENAQAWFEANNEFGDPDIYGSVIGDLEDLSRRTGVMEILGPKPDQVFQALNNRALQAGATGPLARAKEIIATPEAAYNVVTSRVNQSANEFLDNLSTGARMWLGSAQLNSALLSSMGDPWTTRMTLTAQGIPAYRYAFEHLKRFTKSKADRMAAGRIALGMDASIQGTQAALRWGEMSGTSRIGTVFQTLIRASGLEAWTEGHKRHIGMSMVTHFGSLTGRKFDSLTTANKNLLRRNGITPAHWDVIRAAAPDEINGVPILAPTQVMHRAGGITEAMAKALKEAGEAQEAEAGLRGSRPAALGRRLAAARSKVTKLQAELSFQQDAANRYQEMIISEMTRGVVEPEAGVRAVVTGAGSARGTGVGELSRAFFAYKSFSLSMVQNQLMRGLYHETYSGGKFNRTRYLMAHAVGLTTMGVISEMAYDVANGRDIKDPFAGKTWMSGFLRGGGAGIWADLLTSGESRYGKGPLETLLGPVWSLGSDVAGALYRMGGDALEGEVPEFSKEAVRFAKRYTPGTNMWYTRLALQRLFWDQLQKVADPKANSSFRRMATKMRRETGREFYWEPGELTPERLPEMAEAD